MSPPPNDRASGSVATLSPRRRELLELLSKGLTNDEIASALSIAPGTVRIHVSAILAHLEVANRTEAAAAFLRHEARPARVERVLGRPAIAVLPLSSLDAVASTRAIAGGLTEDLASLFSRWCWFPVISTASSRRERMRGRSTDDVAKVLGARFVVDGSVRSTPRGVRVALRVDDVTTGSVIWTDQRDLRFASWLEEQDELCVAMVSAAYPVMVAHATIRAPDARPAVELAAWELAHQGMSLRALRNSEANARATELFREAIARDPSLVLAYYGIGLASYDAVLNQWGSKEGALDTLQLAATRCLELAPHGAEGHFLHARHLQALGHWSTAIEPLETAIGRNPSFALAHATLAQSLIVSGDPDDALVRMRHAERLGPHSFQAGLSTLHFMKAEYVLALQAAEVALTTTPHYPFAHALAAASAWWLGEVPRGVEHLRALHAANPAFEPTSFSATFGKEVDSVDRLARALRLLARAG